MRNIIRIGIPDNVLKKPGAFSPDERVVMDRHAEMGTEILGRAGATSQSCTPCSPTSTRPEAAC